MSTLGRLLGFAIRGVAVPDPLTLLAVEAALAAIASGSACAPAPGERGPR